MDDASFQFSNVVVMDRRLFSCVGNMVLLPTPLKAFTDEKRSFVALDVPDQSDVDDQTDRGHMLGLHGKWAAPFQVRSKEDHHMAVSGRFGFLTKLSHHRRDGTGAYASSVSVMSSMTARSKRAIGSSGVGLATRYRARAGRRVFRRSWWLEV